VVDTIPAARPASDLSNGAVPGAGPPVCDFDRTFTVPNVRI
jgi:hypothetical protein